MGAHTVSDKQTTNKQAKHTQSEGDTCYGGK